MYVFTICVVFVVQFQLDTSPLRGAVDSATFIFEYSSFPHFPPRYAGGLWEVFGMTSPCLRACTSLQFAFFVSLPRPH